MSNYKTALDLLSAYLSPAIRTISDFETNLTGTKTQVLRVKKNTADAWLGNAGRDVFGDDSFKLEVECEVISEIIIQYPANKIWIFGERNTQIQETKTTSLTIEEELPIKFQIMLHGNYITKPVAMMQDDIIIDYFIDENNNIIPIYLEVKQLFADIFGKNLVRKSGTLAPYRGKFEKPIDNLIKKYIARVIAGQI